MNIYEKKLAQIERRNEPVHSYKATVTAISKEAKEDGVEKVLTNWEYTFYYDDPAETVEQREGIALQYARETFSRIFHGDINSRTPGSQKRSRVEFGKDYKIEIKKVI